MTAALTQIDIVDAFHSACEAELQALKPGNVHVFAPGHDMDISHFRRAAHAAAPHLADPQRSIGARILGAVEASLAAADCNTNLGIILLCAPLAAAAQRRTVGQDLQSRLVTSLADLGPSDADQIFAAIRLANPGGLGAPDKGDVNKSVANLSVHDAMQLAADYDRIAAAYVSNFADLFTHHLPALNNARDVVGDGSSPLPAAAPRVVTTLYMRMLADFPDSHIGRKYGAATARAVQEQARAMQPHWSPVFDPTKNHPALLEWDGVLKEKGLNPGTTADFVVATLLAHAIIDRLPQPKV